MMASVNLQRRITRLRVLLKLLDSVARWGCRLYWQEDRFAFVIESPDNRFVPVHIGKGGVVLLANTPNIFLMLELKTFPEFSNPEAYEGHLPGMLEIDEMQRALLSQTLSNLLRCRQLKEEVRAAHRVCNSSLMRLDKALLSQLKEEVRRLRLDKGEPVPYVFKHFA